MSANLRRLLVAGILAGIGGGLIAAILQQIFLVPLILGAEAIELGGAQHVQHGFDRVLLTALFDGLGGIGFALLLAAAFAWRTPASWKQGLAWGLAGYASFSLAPALGLPPELPGVQSAALIARQLWWLGCVASTAVGIAGCVFARARSVKLVGLGLIVLPHFIGAPGGETAAVWTNSPARDFAVGSLAVSLIMWSVIGVLTALLMRRGAVARATAVSDVRHAG